MEPHYYDPFPADWYNTEGEYTRTWMMGYSEDSHEYIRLYRLLDKQIADENEKN